MSAEDTVSEKKRSAELAPVWTIPHSPGLPAVHPGYRDFLDTLRSLAKIPRRARFVLAPVSDEADLGPVLAGIRDEARRRGVSVLVGLIRSDADSPPSAEALTRPATLSGPTVETVRGTADQDVTWAVSSPGLQEWLINSDHEYDLKLILAPSIGSTLEAAFLGKQCDGVVLLVEPLRTTRRELRTAVTRMGRAGCRLAGLVIRNEPSWIPGWIARFLP